MGTGFDGMERLRKFVAYWVETFTCTKKEHDLIVGIVFLIALVLAVLGFSKAFINPVITGISTAAAVVLGARAIFWLPFKRYEEQEKRHAQEKLEWSNKSVAPSDTMPQQLEKIIRKDKVNRLGDWLVELQNIKKDIGKISVVHYTEAVGKEKDVQIVQTLNSIINFLQEHVSRAEAAIFRDAKPRPLPPQTSFYDMDNQVRMREGQLAFLEAHIAELKLIITRHLEL